MSYCQKGPASDVYVFPSHTGYACMGCPLATTPGYDTTFMHTRAALLEHLRQHRVAGHKVPDAAIERLRKELGQ